MTYITKHVDKRVVGAVRHCQPVTAEKDDVDVGIPEQSTVNTSCQHNITPPYLYLLREGN